MSQITYGSVGAPPGNRRGHPVVSTPGSCDFFPERGEYRRKLFVGDEFLRERALHITKLGKRALS
jgi:hypothetical protein